MPVAKALAFVLAFGLSVGAVALGQAQAPDCRATLVAALRAVEPFVPATAVPPPPQPVQMPAQCDRNCKDEYRSAFMQRLRVQDAELQKARQQMAEAIKECGS